MGEPVTKDEAARVLAQLAGSFPNTPVAADTSEAWFNSALRDVPFPIGAAAMVQLCRTAERFPTPAAFNATVRTIRERQEAAKARRALPPAAPDPATQAAFAKLAQAALGEERASGNDDPRALHGAGGHYHHNPDDPCRKCLAIPMRRD